MTFSDPLLRPPGATSQHSRRSQPQQGFGSNYTPVVPEKAKASSAGHELEAYLLSHHEQREGSYRPPSPGTSFLTSSEGLTLTETLADGTTLIDSLTDGTGTTSVVTLADGTGT